MSIHLIYYQMQINYNTQLQPIRNCKFLTFPIINQLQSISNLQHTQNYYSYRITNSNNSSQIIHFWKHLILDASDNNIQNLDPRKLINLKELYANRNKLTQFPRIDIEFLQKLHLDDNKLRKINLYGSINLKELYISCNQINQLKVGKLGLQRIIANNNKIKKVDITKLNKIRFIDFNNNKIQQIVLQNESLQRVAISYNRIYKINLDKLTNLKQLNVQQLYHKNKHHKTEQFKTLEDFYKQFAEDGQILNKLGFYPIITKEEFSKIIQSINYQYDKKIYIENQVQQ